MRTALVLVGLLQSINVFGSSSINTPPTSDATVTPSPTRSFDCSTPTYQVMRQEIVQEHLECPITLDEVDNKGIIIRRSLNSNIFDVFQPDSIAKWLENSNLHPLNRREFYPGELRRIQLYNTFDAKHKESAVPSKDHLVNLLKDLLDRKLSVNHASVLYLHRYGSFDVTDALFGGLNKKLTEMKEKEQKLYSVVAEELLNESKVGTFTFRPSSVNSDYDTKKIVVRTLSVKREGAIQHYRFAHVLGFGFINIFGIDNLNQLDLDALAKTRGNYASLMHMIEDLNLINSGYVTVSEDKYKIIK